MSRRQLWKYFWYLQVVSEIFLIATGTLKELTVIDVCVYVVLCLLPITTLAMDLIFALWVAMYVVNHACGTAVAAMDPINGVMQIAWGLVVAAIAGVHSVFVFAEALLLLVCVYLNPHIPEQAAMLCFAMLAVSLPMLALMEHHMASAFQSLQELNESNDRLIDGATSGRGTLGGATGKILSMSPQLVETFEGSLRPGEDFLSILHENDHQPFSDFVDGLQASKTSALQSSRVIMLSCKSVDSEFEIRFLPYHFDRKSDVIAFCVQILGEVRRHSPQEATAVPHVIAASCTESCVDVDATSVVDHDWEVGALHEAIPEESVISFMTRDSGAPCAERTVASAQQAYLCSEVLFKSCVNGETSSTAAGSSAGSLCYSYSTAPSALLEPPTSQTSAISSHIAARAQRAVMVSVETQTTAATCGATTTTTTSANLFDKMTQTDQARPPLPPRALSKSSSLSAVPSSLQDMTEQRLRQKQQKRKAHRVGLSKHNVLEWLASENAQCRLPQFQKTPMSTFANFLSQVPQLLNWRKGGCCSHHTTWMAIEAMARQEQAQLCHRLCTGKFPWQCSTCFAVNGSEAEEIEEFELCLCCFDVVRVLRPGEALSATVTQHEPPGCVGTGSEEADNSQNSCTDLTDAFSQIDGNGQSEVVS